MHLTSDILRRQVIEAFCKKKMKLPYKQRHIKSLHFSGYLDIRPLEFSEIQKLLILARNTGFYGNRELQSYLIDCSVLNEDEKININELDIFLKFIIAREAWLVTLLHIEKTIEKFKNFIDKDALLKIKCKKTRPYKYNKLLSPGLLWLIRKDMEKVNVDLYVDEIINSIVPAIKVQGKELKGEEKRKEIDRKLGSICNLVLTENFIDIDLDDMFPSDLFTIRERFYISMQIAETLNWNQYVNLAIGFNHCVENLNLQSNRLGGIDTKKGVLISGFPAFFELLQHPKSLPLLVVASLANDIFHKNQIPLSKHYKGIVKKAFNDAMESVAKNEKNKSFSPEEFFFEFLNDFAPRITSNKLLRYQLCYCYWEEFSNSLKEYIDEKGKEFIIDYSINKMPDCYILVEGVSEEICFKKIINILNETDFYLKVINCKSKSGVYSKYRDVIHNESYIGAIVTILDADASSEQSLIKKIKLNKAIAVNYIYEFGEFEDLFSIEFHVDTINNITLRDKKISVQNFDKDMPLVNQLKKIFWEKLKFSFDKKIYAENLSEAIENKEQIPVLIQEIIHSALKLAEKQSKSYNKLTVHAIDSMSKNLDYLVEKAF